MNQTQNPWLDRSTEILPRQDGTNESPPGQVRSARTTPERRGPPLFLARSTLVEPPKRAPLDHGKLREWEKDLSDARESIEFRQRQIEEAQQRRKAALGKPGPPVPFGAPLPSAEAQGAEVEIRELQDLLERDRRAERAHAEKVRTHLAETGKEFLDMSDPIVVPAGPRGDAQQKVLAKKGMYYVRDGMVFRGDEPVASYEDIATAMLEKSAQAEAEEVIEQVRTRAWPDLEKAEQRVREWTMDLPFKYDREKFAAQFEKGQVYMPMADALATDLPLGVGERVIATKVPEEDQPLFLLLYEKQLAEHQVMERSGYRGRTGVGVARGFLNIGMKPAEWMGVLESLTPEQEMFAMNLEAVRHGEDPVIRPDTPMLGRGVQQAAAMAPHMIMAAAAGRTLALKATQLGFGKTVAVTAQRVGVTAAFMPSIIQDAYVDYLAQGIDPDIAWYTAAVIGPIESAVESFLPDPFHVKMGPWRGTLRRVSAEVAKDYLKRFGGEWTEEIVQGMVRAIGARFSEAVDPNKELQGFDTVLWAGVEAGLETALPLALTMAPSGAYGGGVAAMASSGRKKRLQAIRHFRKSMGGMSPKEVAEIANAMRAPVEAAPGLARWLDKVEKQLREKPSAEQTQKAEVKDAEQVGEAGPDDAGRGAQPEVREEGWDTAEGGPGVREGGQAGEEGVVTERPSRQELAGPEVDTLLSELEAPETAPAPETAAEPRAPEPSQERGGEAAEDVVDAYKASSPELAALFESDSGVKEGYSVEQHTRRVLSQWRRETTPEALQEIGDRAGIADLGSVLEHAVALHDIGKPRAVAKGRRSYQHAETLPILRAEMERRGFSGSQIRLAEALVGNDILGEVLRGERGAGPAIFEIGKLAERSGLAPVDFFEVLSSFYKADAGSYPALRETLFTEGPGGKLTLPAVEFGILEEWFYGELREAGWSERLGPKGKGARGAGVDRGGVPEGRFLHGTAINFDTYDESKDSGRNLVGRGLYLLAPDDADVAEHYAKRALNRAMSVFSPDTRRRIFESKPEFIKSQADKLRRKAGEFDAKGDGKRARQHRMAADVLEAILAKRLGKKVIEFNFKPRRVFEMGSQESRGRLLTPTEIAEILDAVPEESRNKVEDELRARNEPRAWAVYEHIGHLLGGKEKANNVLRRAGYDAIQFVHAKGGYHRPYNVVVSLRPEHAKKVTPAPSPRAAPAEREPSQPVQPPAPEQAKEPAPAAEAPQKRTPQPGEGKRAAPSVFKTPDELVRSAEGAKPRKQPFERNDPVDYQGQRGRVIAEAVGDGPVTVRFPGGRELKIPAEKLEPVKASEAGKAELGREAVDAMDRLAAIGTPVEQIAEQVGVTPTVVEARIAVGKTPQRGERRKKAAVARSKKTLEPERKPEAGMVEPAKQTEEAAPPPPRKRTPQPGDKRKKPKAADPAAVDAMVKEIRSMQTAIREGRPQDISREKIGNLAARLNKEFDVEGVKAVFLGIGRTGNKTYLASKKKMVGEIEKSLEEQRESTERTASEELEPEAQVPAAEPEAAPADVGKWDGERTTPRQGTRERAALDAETEAAYKAWDDAKNTEDEIKADLEKTKRYTKKYENLEKQRDKATEVSTAAWKKYDELRNRWLRARLEDAAEQTENPALAVAARWGLREAAEDAYARAEERERVHRRLVELMRPALAEAIAAEGDGAGRLPAAVDKEVIESVLKSAAGDAMSNPLLMAKDMVDRLRGRLRGERIRRYQSLKVLELEGEGEEVGGYVRKIHETFDFERVDQIVAEAKAKREEARERERRTAAAAEAQARANADALTGLETKGARVTDKRVWSGNRVADDSTFVSDGRSLVDTRHVGKDDAGRLRKKDKTWGGPPASHSRVAEVWRKSTDDPGVAAQFLGVDPEGDHAFFRLKSGELLAVPPEQVAYFSRVVAPDEWRAKGHDSPLVGMKKGKPAVVIMPITGKKWVAIEYPLDVARAAARGLTIGPQEPAEPTKRAKRRVDDRGHAAQRGQPPTPTQLQVAPDQVSSSMAKTEDGKKLLDRLVQDSKKGTKGAYRVGRRSIFEALAQMLHSRIVVARSQTTKKRPGKYLPVPHLWFTKSGTDAPTNLHEAGHALLTYLADQQALPTDFLNALESFAEAQMPPNGYASAVDPHEGMAEMLRLWVQEPDAIPGDLRAEFERIARERLPGLMDGMEDVRLAYRFHENRDPMQQLQSSVLDRPRGAGRISRAKAAFFEAAYNLLGSSPGWSYIERGIWRAMTKSPEAIGRRVRRKMQQATREIMRSLDDTPADVLTYRSILYELESVISHAVHGTNPETKGIRVHLLEHWDTIFGEGEVAEAAIQKLRDAGIDVPESVPFGHFLTVHDRSIADTKAAVGDENWEGFLTYGQWRTALYRHERLGHDYPLMDRFPPGVLSDALKTMEGEHPDWPAHYKAVQKIQDQSLLLDVLSGERTIDDVVRMKKAHEDYWTLPRAVEHRAGSTAPGGQHPSSGIRPTKGGSLLPFLGEGDVVAEKVRRAVTAYYDIAAKRSLLRLQEQMRNHKRWKDLPFSGRKYVESLMVPLKMDIKLAATLGPAELQEMFADAINGYLEREAGRPLLDEEKIAPGDVELDEQFRPVFRGTPPRMARVLSLFDPKTPGKRQYYYVPDPLVFDLQVGRGGTLPDWAMNILAMGAEVTAPWRRAKTQNWVFTLGNVPRDIATNVLIGEGFIPGGDHAVGLVHEILGSDEAEMLATEMMSRSIQGVTHEQHRGVWGSFVETATEGIVIPGYREMTPGQKAMRIPGQISSTVFKSVELPNWALFGQWASQKSERLGRHGSFHRARGRGASPLRAQRSLATGTGHFSQHSNTRAVAQAYRWAGFANPHLQIMWQIFDRATHPDPRVRAAFWAVRVPMLAGVGVGLAALTYLGWTLWYRDKDELEKRLQRERERTTWDRTRYFHVGPMKFPFESGLPGGVMSATYVLTMDKLLNHEGDRSVLATSVMQKLREMPGLIPPHILPAAEVALDYSFFFDREVVHPALRSQHPDVPYLQTWDDTPTPYKVAAEWMDSLPDFMKASPEQLRYLVRSMVDSLADDLIAAAGRAIDGDAPAKVLLGNEWADMPMFGRRVVREPRGYGSQPVVDLRKAAKEFDALRDKIADLRHRGVSPERVSELQEQATQFEFAAMMSDVVNDLFREAKENRKAKNLDEARAVEREMTEAAVLFFRMVENKLDSKEVREKVMPPLLRKLTAKVERAFVAPPRKQREGEKAPRMRIGETEGAFEVRKSLWEKTGQPESDEDYAAYLETWKQARDDDRAFFVRYRDTPVVRQALEQVRAELRRKKPQMPARDTEESIQAWRRRRAVWSQKYRRLQEILGER